MKLRLNSEFGNLKAVIMHRPGKEIDRLTPYNIKEMLFDDVPYLEEMQKEHDIYTLTIKENTEATVYRLHELLMDVLADEKLLVNAFRYALSPSGLSLLAEEIIFRLSTSECAHALIAGLKIKELQKKFKHPGFDDLSDINYAILPSPNLYFMRDPAAIIQTGIISSQMKYPGRQMESFIMKMIFENHHLFKRQYHQIYPKDQPKSKLPSIEGGDIIILSDKALAIGCSERTDTEAIQQVAKEVLKNDQVERVYEVFLPKKRNFMHLDTVFTIIDENLVITYPDAMNSVLKTKVYRKKGLNEKGEVVLESQEINKSIISILNTEIPYLEIIETGAGNPDYASREQWYDGANVFAIGPRRVISYNRNKHTNQALQDAGVEVITIPSSELSRGLGGPRCMTMPLERQEI
jgi:arginine deiminase